MSMSKERGGFKVKRHGLFQHLKIFVPNPLPLKITLFKIVCIGFFRVEILGF